MDRMNVIVGIRNSLQMLKRLAISGEEGNRSVTDQRL